MNHGTRILCVALALVVARPAAARDLLWHRDEAGRLVVQERAPRPGETLSDLDREPTGRGSGSLQRLAFPVPPGPTDFDRAIAEERERVTRKRAAERAHLERALAKTRDAERVARKREEAAEKRREKERPRPKRESKSEKPRKAEPAHERSRPAPAPTR